jgi:hypothetical protein
MRKLIAVMAIGTWVFMVGWLLVFNMMTIEARMDNLRQERAHWPTIEGTVTQIDFHDADSTDDNDYSYAIIRYNYTQSGINYSAWQQIDYFSENQKQNIQYKAGQKLMVYYDPSNICSAVIDPSKVDIYETTPWWETVLRIFAFPSMILGSIFIWQIITVTNMKNDRQTLLFEEENSGEY